MSDIDGDSTMHSSPSENEMFPDEALPPNPATPMTTSISTLAATELSPPNSQGGPGGAAGSSAVARDTSSLAGSSVNANGKRPLSLAQSNATAGGGTHTDVETGYSWTKLEEQPGWAWKNTRARDEETRALDQIVDMWNQVKLKYGDPLDASVPAKPRR